MLSFNVNVVAECIRNICDNTQCITCGKLIGPCVRFSCGHSTCEVCAEKTSECVFCVTSSSDSYVLDKPQTVRLKNISALLTIFHDTFNVDVYQRQRISDHLKLEKQVFPGCIQAPNRYFNKRKSLNTSTSNKENIDSASFLGGQSVCSDTVKMKKSYQYVQNWLNEHEDVPQSLPRRPFGDININTQSTNHKAKKNVAALNKVNTEINLKKSTCRKKSYHKSKKNSSSFLKDLMKSNLKHCDVDKQQPTIEVENVDEFNSKHKSDRSESGIVADDEPIVVENTQNDVISKDYLAWLSVLRRADKDEYKSEPIPSKHKSQSNYNENSLLDINKAPSFTGMGNVNATDRIASRLTKPVLFFKKATLQDTCNLCNQSDNSQTICHSKAIHESDVSITINNAAFVTTIQFMHIQNNDAILNKNTIAIQTDEPAELADNKIVDGESVIKQKRKNILIDEVIPTKKTKPNVATQSLDIFTTDRTTEHMLQSNCDKDSIKKNICNNASKQTKHLIIEDSDTDSSINRDNIHEVVADVHSTSVPENVQGILKPLSETDYQRRSKQPLRGHTPNSSDSSDKENLDPNRNKQSRFGKKLKNKKLTNTKDKFI